MPTVPVAQNSFAGGELDPAFSGRVDLPQYAKGCRRLRNAFIHSHGGASNRPGTEYRATAAGQNVLLPFQFSVVQAYVLEMSNFKMRIYKDGDLVLYPLGHPDAGDVVEITHPFAIADMPLVKITQAADVMYLSHPSYDTQKLTRTDHHLWTFVDAPTTSGLSGPTGASATPSAVGTGRNFKYRVVAVVNGEETLPSTEVSCNFAKIWAAGEFVTVAWSAYTDAQFYRVYANKRGQYGLIGEVAAGTLSFIDDNIDPDVTETYIGDVIADFTVANGHPGCVGIHQQRLWFARSNNEPQTVWGSRTGLFGSFSTRLQLVATDPVAATLATNQVNEIKHILPLDKMIILTSSSEWVLDAGNNADAITPTALRFRVQGYRGCNDVPPVVVGESIMFISRSGNIIRDLRYVNDAGGYVGADLTVFARHLFEGHQIVSWAYQGAPYGIIWAVREDGALLAFTFLREHEIWAWSLCETDGAFESVTTIPRADGYDEIYFSVKRVIDGGTFRFVERLAERFADDPFFVDAGLTYAGDNAGATTMALTGSGVTAGTLLTITASAATWTNSQGLVSASFEAGNVGDAIHFTLEDGSTVVAVIEAFTSSTSVDARIDCDVPPATLGTPYIAWRKAINTVSGLAHLEGKAVAVIADGNVVEGMVVDAGAITLPRPYTRIHVGLPHVSELTTMSMEVNTNAGSSQGRKKAHRKVRLRVVDTRGAQVGPYGAELVDVKWRSEESYDEPTALYSGDKEVAVESKWSADGAITLRQSAPLPWTVLSIMSDLELGD